MLPRNLRNVVNIFPSTRIAGYRANFLVLPVVTSHNHAYQYALPVSTFSTKADLESISKLAAEADYTVNTVETGVVGALIDRGPLPLITKRKLEYIHPCRTPRQAWVENLDTIEEKKLGLVDLHPDVFGAFPRIELIHSNVNWQQLYKRVDWA